jgi:hypothetical protein
MTAQTYLVRRRCERCNLHLFRSPESVGSAIVFCDHCLAGGPYDDVMQNGKALIQNFVTRRQVEQMLQEIRPLRL